MSDEQNNSSQGSSPATPPGPASSVIGGDANDKKKWDPKGKRNLIFIGCVFLVATLAFVFMGHGKDKAPPSYIPQDIQANGQGMAGQEDLAREKNQESQRVARAKSAGQSAVESTPEGQKMEDVTKQQGGQVEQPQNGAGRDVPQQAPVNNSQVTAREQQRDQQRQQALQDQMKQQFVSWGMSANGGDTASGRFYTRAYAKATNAGASGASSSSAATADAKADGSDQVVIEAYKEIYGAETISTYDSDQPLDQRVRMLSGPLTGAVLSGTAQRVGERYVHISYTEANYKGKTFKVNAEALDEESSSELVEGNYDGRYGERYLFPILSEGIKGYATAKAQPGSQIVVVNGGGVAQETPPSSTNQAINAMVAAGADQAAKALNSSNVKSQVALSVKKTVAVRFLQSVYASDLAGSKK
jgi:intracellular multiplication protein IcmE